LCQSESHDVVSKTKIEFNKRYQAHLAQKKVRIKVKTTGNIVDLKYTEEMIKSAKADLVNYIRQFINSPT
tara:strand:- start:105 stop:314 length:210 start_codon:yes stop_codon:yes gene_type:complete